MVPCECYSQCVCLAVCREQTVGSENGLRGAGDPGPWARCRGQAAGPGVCGG